MPFSIVIGIVLIIMGAFCLFISPVFGLIVIIIGVGVIASETRKTNSKPTPIVYAETKHPEPKATSTQRTPQPKNETAQKAASASIADRSSQTLVESVAVPPTNSIRSKIKAIPKQVSTSKDLEVIQEYVVLDTETTGLDRFFDRIVEIAVVRYDNRGEKLAEFRSLINPQIPISAAASSVNHITNKDVADAPLIENVLPDILHIIGQAVVVGHNVTFDLDFLGREIPQDQQDFQVEYIDTISLAKRAFPDQASYKLADLVTKLGIATSQEHRAFGDVELTAKLFESCRTALTEAYKKELVERKAERNRKKAEKAEAFAWSPLLEKNFVFTGDFENDRDQLEEELQKVGANLRPEVNRNTDYLVMGELKNLPQWALERKYLKAKETQDKGGKVKILTEAEYTSLLQEILAKKTAQ